MIDMILNTKEVTGQQHQKINKKLEGNKNFGDVFIGKMNAFNDTKTTTPTTNNSLEIKTEAKNLATIQPKQQDAVKEKIVDEDVTEECKKDSLLAVESLLQQLQLILIQLDEGEVTEVEALKEIEVLMEELQPAILTQLQGELKESIEFIKTHISEMEEVVFSEAMLFNLEEIKSSLPVALEELKTKLSEVEEVVIEDKTVKVLSGTDTNINNFNKLNPAQNLNLKESAVEVQVGNEVEDFMVSEIDLTAEVKVKEIKKDTSLVEEVVVEEIPEATVATNEIPLEGFKQIQQVITHMEQQESIQVDPKTLIQQVVSKVDLLTQNGKSEMRIQLMPENLGNLFINISMDKGSMTAKVYAENQQIKELIDSNLSQLKISLGEKGINVSSLEVSVGHNQQDFNGTKSFLQQKNKLKVKKVQQPNSNMGIQHMSYVEEARSGNPYLVNSKFDGLV